jgi:ABC-type transport system involved in Fe-S cluster assembly fused permease/ATPase subunit
VINARNSVLDNDSVLWTYRRAVAVAEAGVGAELLTVVRHICGTAALVSAVLVFLSCGIARALAGNPEILILDDSSGGLDYKTDALLRSNIAKKYQSCTKIFVAQRVATIKDCDRIIVLDRGKVVGDGKHAYLMENCPLYKETALCQMGQRLG